MVNDLLNSQRDQGCDHAQGPDQGVADDPDADNGDLSGYQQEIEGHFDGNGDEVSQAYRNDRDGPICEDFSRNYGQVKEREVFDHVGYLLQPPDEALIGLAEIVLENRPGVGKLRPKRSG